MSEQSPALPFGIKEEQLLASPETVDLEQFSVVALSNGTKEIVQNKDLPDRLRELNENRTPEQLEAKVISQSMSKALAEETVRSTH